MRRADLDCELINERVPASGAPRLHYGLRPWTIHHVQDPTLKQRTIEMSQRASRERLASYTLARDREAHTKRTQL